MTSLLTLLGTVVLASVGAAVPPDAGATDPVTARDPAALLDAMGEAASRVGDYRMVMVRQERFGKALADRETIEVKWARPHSMYIRYRSPHRGREAIFRSGWNRDRLRVHKGSFPDINLNVNPRGNLAMSGTHHPASEASLVYFVGIVMDNVKLGRRRSEGEVRWVEEQTLWGRPAVLLEMTSPRGGFFHTLEKGEDLWDVAARYRRNMYAILHHNRDKGWSKPNHPDAGDRVFVPRYYAGRLRLWIDRELLMPIKAEVYDHDGLLYEYYEHRELQVNVGHGPHAFDPTNPEYDF